MMSDHDAEENDARSEREKLIRGEFDLDDFRRQIVALKKIGVVKDLISRLGGPSSSGLEDIDFEGELKRIQGIIDSMTPDERRDPRILSSPRRRRIAAGAGVKPSDVSSLMQQFETMARLVKQMARKNPPAPKRARTSFRGADRTTAPMNRYNWMALWNIQKRNLLLWDFLTD